MTLDPPELAMARMLEQMRQEATEATAGIQQNTQMTGRQKASLLASWGVTGLALILMGIITIIAIRKLAGK